MVEGTWTADGYFKAGLIMAKHSEEYKAPHDASQAGLQGAGEDAEREGIQMSARQIPGPGVLSEEPAARACGLTPGAAPANPTLAPAPAGRAT